MKTVLKVLPLIFLASSCAHVSGSLGSSADEQSPLPERVQEMVVAVQSDAIEALPAEIAGFTSSEPVADREKNQRGAGFTRVYMLDDAVVTVFLYNNQEFGAKNEITPLTESLMDKHLNEFQAMQDSGLFEDVKIGDKKTREFKWHSVPYAVTEAEINYKQKDEPKTSFLVLGGNSDLMSFVRIRFTYPKTMQRKVSGKKNVFTRTVMSSLHDFAQSLKPKAKPEAAETPETAEGAVAD